MRAMVLERVGRVETDPLVLRDVPPAAPGAGEVLVRVRACGVCRTDVHTAEGDVPVPRFPVILGHQVVGVVEERGPGALRVAVGQRVGLAWLAHACGTCVYCLRGDENLCEAASFRGLSVDGGYAERVVAREDFVYPLPEAFGDEPAAPLLCAGIIGYRALKLAGAGSGRRVGLYGFGASAHIAAQVAVHWGCEVFVISRSESHRRLARRLGATWAGSAGERPPAPLGASVVFAPAGSVVLDALRDLERGGTVALAGVTMTPIPEMSYEEHLFCERTLRSVTASTRRDAHELLALAGEIPIRTEVTTLPLEDANEALRRVKRGEVDGAIVLDVALGS